MNTCKLCSKQFEDDLTFHKHLRSHKMTQTVYYQTYFPRYDKYDNSIILYKNKAYYFSVDFNSKNNFKKWLTSVSIDDQKKYVVEFLKNRIEKKKLIFAPAQIELRTMMIPGIRYINKNLGGYEKICSELGLKNRFSLTNLDESKFLDVRKKVIFADTREQDPLDFDNTTRTKGMNFGDYRMAGSQIYIERKSLGDAWGTLTGGHERFEREIIRAGEANAYLVILVESPFDSLERYPFQRQVYGKIKIPVEFVYHTIRELMQKYQHIQFLFVKDREEASRVIQKLFAADEQVRKVDLQYLYDTEKL